MIIKIDKKKLSIKEERQNKLLSLSGVDINLGYGFNWHLKPENPDENLEDFELFCLSIAKDLFEKKFYTNEKGAVTHNLNNLDCDGVAKNISKLIDIIKNKKL